MLNFSKIENSKNIFNDIENHNKILTERLKNEQGDLFKNKLKFLNHYIKRNNSINVYDLKKYIGDKLC